MKYLKKNKKKKINESNGQSKVNIEKGKDRETKLNIIKEKYKNGAYDDSKDEINNKNKEIEKINEQADENKENHENIINNNDNNNLYPENIENSGKDKEEMQMLNNN